jgi:radical SAM superfamily enzyme YgiQ (UPF0313 family)
LREKVDLLLINPWVYDFACYDLWSKPLGLLYIASMLKDYGYTLKLVDCMYRYHDKLNYYKDEKYGCGHYYSEEIPKPKVYKDIPRRYKRYGIPPLLIEEIFSRISPKAVLITSIMTYWYLGVYDMIRLVRKYFKDTPILLGGIYVTLCYEHAKEYQDADFIIKGNDIKKVLELIDNIFGIKRDYSNFYKSLDEYPKPFYELYPINKYICISTSIGCPYNCIYCAVRFLAQNKFYQRNPIKVVDEIEYFYKKLKIKDFVFYDDALLVNAKKHLCVVLEEILKRGINCNFHTPNGLSVEGITKDLAKLMYRTNFKTIRLSFESSSTKWQETTKKNLHPEALDYAIHNLKQAGYTPKEIEVYVMTGMPNQSFTEIKQSIEYVYKLKAKIKLVEYSPIPHTDLWKELNLSSDEDPLLHNNSILRFQQLKEYKKLKELVNIYNNLI